MPKPILLVEHRKVKEFDADLLGIAFLPSVSQDQQMAYKLKRAIMADLPGADIISYIKSYDMCVVRNEYHGVCKWEKLRAGFLNNRVLERQQVNPVLSVDFIEAGRIRVIVNYELSSLDIHQVKLLPNVLNAEVIKESLYEQKAMQVLMPSVNTADLPRIKEIFRSALAF